MCQGMTLHFSNCPRGWESRQKSVPIQRTLHAAETRIQFERHSISILVDADDFLLKKIASTFLVNLTFHRNQPFFSLEFDYC